MTEIVNANTTATPEVIASELSACGSYLQLKGIKAEYGEALVKQAWTLLPAQERMRLKGICQSEPSQPAEENLPVVEQPVEPDEGIPPRRTLFAISTDLEMLNELLNEWDEGDEAQHRLLVQWFEQLGDDRDHKLDNYAALITEMQARAELRTAEAGRLLELAQADENRARLLKDRLKWFFETHNLKTVETARYKLQLQRHGGKVPLILDESVPVTQLPEQFQKVSIAPDTAAIRSALEAGETLLFAHFGERGTSMRIK